jgi:hypothetical protein
MILASVEEREKETRVVVRNVFSERGDFLGRAQAARKHWHIRGGLWSFHWCVHFDRL